MLQLRMFRFILFALIAAPFSSALEIRQTPIKFGTERMKLTQRYINHHYGTHYNTIFIEPRIIVIHHTAVPTFIDSWARFNPTRLLSDRKDIQDAGALNVSVHYMVDRDGTVHQLMPDDIMARHVIGLNYSSIGIENVGGSGQNDALTAAQLQANAALVAELLKSHASIEYLIGHFEYRCFENHPLWLELDPGYRTEKWDPGAEFINELRSRFPQLKPAPCND